jgi:hypothetical protein
MDALGVGSGWGESRKSKAAPVNELMVSLRPRSSIMGAILIGVKLVVSSRDVKGKSFPRSPAVRYIGPEVAPLWRDVKWAG